MVQDQAACGPRIEDPQLKSQPIVPTTVIVQEKNIHGGLTEVLTQPILPTQGLNGKKPNDKVKTPSQEVPPCSSRLQDPSMATSQSNFPKAGTPNTSRFLRTLDSSASSFTTHHYNPYLYTQHKTRPNAPFDIMHIKNKKLISDSQSEEQLLCTDSGLKYSITEGHIPVFRIRKEDLPDPVTFYEQVEDIGKKYGAVKVIIIQRAAITKTHDSDQMHQTYVNLDRAASQITPLTAFSLNTEHFWFKSRRQHLSSFQDEIKRKLDFHRALYNFHKAKKGESSGQGLGKIPSIDKRSLDLYRLRQCVQLRGGFQTVCQKKLWAQIGRELGYTGRIMSSLSTSLRSAYLKVFLEFDKLDEELKPKQIEQSKESTEEDSLTPSSSSFSIMQENNTKKRSFTDIEPNQSRSISRVKKHHKDNRCSFEIGGSSVEFMRLRDILRFKGFSTNFEYLTEHRKNLTKPTSATLPGYQFNFWHNSTEIYEKSAHEMKNSPIYNLRQYHEKAKKHFESIPKEYQEEYPNIFQNNDKIKLEEFEQLFFDILSDGQFSCDVDTGINLLSSIHGSGFSMIGKTNENLACSLDPWNLNNVALSSKSLLRYLDTDYGDHTRTRLDVGMLFSVKGWTVEDNFLPCIDYNHLGSSKLWYIIQPEDMEKFDQLVESLSLNEKSEIIDTSNSMGDEDFKNSEFYHCFLDTNPSSPVHTRPMRMNTHTMFPIPATNAHTAYGMKPKSLPNDVQFHPDFLRAKGIKFLKATQEACSFILKFPRTYSTTVASGFYVSENVHFAPSTWLNYALDSEKWLSKHGILPGIHVLNLFANIVLYSNNPELISKAKHLSSSLITEEINRRDAFQQTMGYASTVVMNSFDFISDISLRPTGASKVILANKTDCFTLSLQEFLDNLEWKQKTPFIFGQCITENGIRTTLHICYTNDQLESIFFDKDQNEQLPRGSFPSLLTSNQNMRMIGSLSLNELINNKYDGKRIPMNELMAISSNTDSLNEVVSVDELRKYISHAEAVAFECRQLLKKTSIHAQEFSSKGFGAGFKIKELPLKPHQCTSDEFRAVTQKVSALSVEIAEMHDIFALWEDFRQFEEDVREAISTANLTELRLMYQKSWSLGILSKYEDPLRKVLCKAEWLDVYQRIFEDHEKVSESGTEQYALDSLPSYLNFGIKYVVELTHFPKLEKVRKCTIDSQEVVSQINKLFKRKNNKISIEQLTLIVTKIEKEHLPFSHAFLDKLKAVLKSIEKRKLDMAPFFTKLGVNDAYIELLHQRLTSMEADVIDLFGKFDGSSEDLRMTMNEVPDMPFFLKHVKKCKSWLHDFNKLLPRRNQLGKILESTETCLDVTSDISSSSSSREQENHYCFCRKGDSGSTMVECEVCREWYHMNCINKGKWTLPSGENNVFICPLCIQHDAINPTTVEFSDLIELAISSSTLKVIPERAIINALFRILKAAISCRLFVHCQLFSNDQIRADAPISTVKFYLRKLNGAGCCMADVADKLSAFCKNEDSKEVERLKNKSTIIVTGFEDVVTKKIVKSTSTSIGPVAVKRSHDYLHSQKNRLNLSQTS